MTQTNLVTSTTTTTPTAAPTASQLSPSTGPTAGGTTVTVLGSNFQSGASVTFGGVASPTVNVIGGSALTAVTPSMPAGALDVVVTNPDGQSSTLPQSFTAVAPPAPSADLSDTLSGPAGTQTPGSDITVQATVANSGPDSSSNTIFTITLAPGLSFNAGSPCSPNGQTATCNFGNIGAGYQGTSQFAIHIDATDTGPYTISSSFTSDTLDPNTANNVTSLTIVAGAGSAPPAPSAPVLAPGFDSGFSSTDGVTNISDPVFEVVGQPNLVTELFELDALVGSAQANDSGVALITPGTALADGLHTLTARQLGSTGAIGDPSGASRVTIDTVAPTLSLSFFADLGSATGGSGLVQQRFDSSTIWQLNGADPGGSGIAGYATSIGGTPPIPAQTFTPFVAPGAYDTTFTVTDLAGNSTSLKRLMVELPDPSAAPKLAIFDDSGVPGDGITNINQPHLLLFGYPFTIATTVGTNLYDFLYIDGSSLAFLPGSAGGFVQTGAPLSDGTYTATSAAQLFLDSVKWDGPLSAPSTLTIDTVAPTLSLSFFADLGSATGGSGLVQQRFDSSTIWQLNGADPGGSGIAGYATSIGGTPPIPAQTFTPFVAPGAYDTTFTVTDLAGNSTSLKRLMVELPDPSAAPKLAIFDDSGVPGDGITNINQPHLLLFGYPFTIATTVGTNLYDFLYIDGSSLAFLPGSAGGFVQTGAPLSDGTYTATSAAQLFLDSVKWDGPLSAPSTLTIDTVAPTITPPGAVTVETTGPRGATAAYGPATVNDATATTVTYSAASGALFPIGVTTVTVTATDAAGNTSAASFTVTVRDTTPPSVTITSPAANQTYDVGQTFTFSYTAGDVVGVASQRATLDGAAIVNGATINTAGMTAGTHTLQVVAADAAGNVTIVTRTFTIRYSTATLQSIVAGVSLPTGPKTALLAVLNVANAALSRHTAAGNVVAKAALNAFLVLVALDRQLGLISTADAARLTTLAVALRDAL